GAARPGEGGRGAARGGPAGGGPRAACHRSGRRGRRGGRMSTMRAREGTGAAAAAAPADPLAALHRDNYAALVRLATVVVGDVGLAEQVVQDAFVKLALRWRGLRGLDNPAAYLHRARRTGCLSLLRRHKGGDRPRASRPR